MSKIEVDTIDTQSSTTLQVGDTNTSLIKIGKTGDTVEYPAGTTFTQSGTQNITAGGAINVKSGGNITIDSGATITNNGTASGFSADLTNLNATNLTSGTVPDARFPATLPIANGSALTNLNATNLGSGTIPDARFPAALPAISGAALTNLPGGGLIFIKKITASSDGSISFQNGSGGVVIDGTYDNYVIKFNNVRPADQNKNLNAQIYTGGTIRTSNYGTTTAIFNGAQGGVSNNTSFQDFTDNCGAWININNQTEKGLFGEICFSTPTDTSQFFTATYSGGTAYDGVYGRVKSYVGTGGYKTSGTAMDGIKFFFNSGNIVEGIFTLYGMVKS